MEYLNSREGNKCDPNYGKPRKNAAFAGVNFIIILFQVNCNPNDFYFIIFILYERFIRVILIIMLFVFSFEFMIN